MNKSVMELTGDLGDALKRMAALLPPQPVKPMRLARGNVKEIGALWEADIEFLLDGDDIDEDGIDVRKVTFDGVEVDYEVLSCEAQEEIVWICMESMK